MRAFVVSLLLALLGTSIAHAQDAGGRRRIVLRDGGGARPRPVVRDGGAARPRPILRDGGIARPRPFARDGSLARPRPARDGATARPRARDAGNTLATQAIDEAAPATLGMDGGVVELGLDAGIAPEASIDLPDGAPMPDGGFDAGLPLVDPLASADAGIIVVVVPAQAEHQERDFLTALNEWMWERAEREREAARREVGEQRGDEGEIDLPPAVRDWMKLAFPERRVSAFGLIIFLALALVGLWLVDRLRKPLPERGLLPRVLGVLHLLVRLATIVIALVLVSRLLPAWLQPALLLSIAAIAVAVGFGAVWVLLPDVIGGLVILTEGRIKRGQWIVGDGFSGSVEQVGPRVTLLRAPDGALLSVPNRHLVKGPVHATERRWHEVEVELRIPTRLAAMKMREAIRDAVLCSPYIPPDPHLALSRDPRDPELWRLRVRLLDVRFTETFEGQLLERVEEAVGAPDQPAE